MASRLIWSAVLACNIAAVAPAAAKTIANDRGGQIIDYAIIVSETKTVRFTGNCDSACTLYLAVPDKCVMPGASFGFHLPYGSTKLETAKAYLWRSYPNWVVAWITANGGLTAEIKRMPYSVIRNHLPNC